MALVARSRAPSEVKSRVSAGCCEATGAGGAFDAVTIADRVVGIEGVMAAASEVGAAGSGEGGVGIVPASAGFGDCAMAASGTGEAFGPLAAAVESRAGIAAGAVTGISATPAGAASRSGITTAAAGASVGAVLSTQPARASEKDATRIPNLMTRPFLMLDGSCSACLQVSFVHLTGS
jgi:hypothetical protein